MSDRVQEWIDKALQVGGKSFYVPFTQSETLSAWGYLRDYRNKCDPTDPDLACAEHYMYARWISSVNTVIGSFLPIIIAGYQLSKLMNRFAQYCGIHLGSNVFGPHASTPPTSAQLFWGMRGWARGFYGDIGFLPLWMGGFLPEVIAMGKELGWKEN